MLPRSLLRLVLACLTLTGCLGSLPMRAQRPLEPEELVVGAGLQVPGSFLFVAPIPQATLQVQYGLGGWGDAGVNGSLAFTGWSAGAGARFYFLERALMLGVEGAYSWSMTNGMPTGQLAEDSPWGLPSAEHQVVLAPRLVAVLGARQRPGLTRSTLDRLTGVIGFATQVVALSADAWVAEGVAPPASVWEQAWFQLGFVLGLELQDSTTTSVGLELVLLPFPVDPPHEGFFRSAGQITFGLNWRR